MILLDTNFWKIIFDTRHIIEYGGLLLVLAIIYLETGFLLGLVLPGGDYMLFTAGMFCGTAYVDISIFWLVTLLVLASYLGDLTGYYKGKWLGDRLFTDNQSRFFKKEYLNRGHVFYTRYGVRAFLLGRFMPIVRTFVPMIAGASHYSFRKFLLFDFLGAVAWVGSLVPLGYFLGKSYPGIMKYSVYFLVIIVIFASYPVLKMCFQKKNRDGN